MVEHCYAECRGAALLACTGVFDCDLVVFNLNIQMNL
jgi:hypothetical protein